MDYETIVKANVLKDRIDKLSSMQSELRPEYCNGVGFCGNMPKNSHTWYYKFNLWASHKKNTDDNTLIMMEAINAAYNKTSELLEEAKKNLKELV